MEETHGGSGRGRDGGTYQVTTKKVQAAMAMEMAMAVGHSHVVAKTQIRSFFRLFWSARPVPREGGQAGR